MPEYRAVRKQHSLLEICKKPRLAAEVTITAAEFLGVDAAIIFADLLLPLEVMGLPFHFSAGEGPVIEKPVRSKEDITDLRTDRATELGYVSEAVSLVAKHFAGRIPVIGFCGAPWTVATYMVAGQGTPDQAPARMLAYRHPEAFEKIIDVLVENSIQYLLGQLKAGADALQIFDTWAGVLPPREFARWSIDPTRRIVAGVRQQVPDAKIIGFPRGAGASLPAYVEATGVDGVSIDWAAEPSLIRARVQNRVAVQGNLDPLALIVGGAALDRAVDDVLENYASGRLIFNLGHGILPETPIAHVEQMIKRVRAYKA